MSNIAAVYCEQFRYAATEPYCLESLRLHEQANSPDNIHIATSCNNLADVYRHQGKHEAASVLYARALSIRRKNPGNAEDYAALLNNIGGYEQGRGRFAAAIRLHRQSLRIQRHTNGPTHPDLAITLGSLANAYAELSDFAESEQLEIESAPDCAEGLRPSAHLLCAQAHVHHCSV